MRHSDFGMMGRDVRRAGGAMLLLHALASPAAAQRVSGSRSELRAEVITSRAPSVQLGVGGSVPAGVYVRLGAVAAGGASFSDGAGKLAARVEAVAHFRLDPYNEFPAGLYGLAGASAMYDGFEGWRPRLALGIGVESRPRRGRIIGGEVALGGGVRLAFVVRRARDSTR